MHDANLLEDQPIAWTPTPDVIERSQLTKFMRQVGVSTWNELYAYSINDVEKFTEEVLKFVDIKFDPPYEKLLDTSNGVEFPAWFAAEDSPQRHGDTESESGAIATGFRSAGLNITTMCLDRWQTDETKGQPAVIWEGEEGGSTTISYEKLLAEVENCAEKLCDLGIGRGDAVGMHVPMIPETVVSLLAINRVGAIAIPVFSGYGIDAITSRMEAVGAKAIFTCDGSPRRGKAVDMLTVAARAIANVATIESVIVVERNSHLNDNIYEDHFDARERRRDEVRRYEHLRSDLFFGKKVALWGVGKDAFSACDARTAKTSAEDPLIILYTSGTTGKPKGIAHTHASFPIKAAQDMAFGTDVGRGTRISWYTDIGWMMGPWLIYGALINGATICIYDGAPDYPAPDRMWEFCAKHKVEILGISPTLIRALSNCGDELPKNHDLSSLRAFASTGEPWNPAPWWWLFEKVGNSKLPIINYSGGTEISGGILMGNPLLPIKPCSFPAPCPGMDVDILDEEGNSVGPGKVGELVIKQPWIGHGPRLLAGAGTLSRYLLAALQRHLGPRRFRDA
jgi:acetyl-CoA synthetase